MAQRASPAEYWRGKMQTSTQVAAPLPMPVTMEIPPATLQLPELNGSAIFILGLVAVVGLLGIFALLASGRCKC